MFGKLFKRTADSTAGSKVWTVSVVTPSYEQAEFLPECLSSARMQTRRPVEHLVFDPGSNDGSRAIAEAAEGVTLIAEADEGQADAVGKGMMLAKGDVIAWLNSDDAYPDAGVFEAVLDRFNAPDRPDIVYGRGVYVDAQGAAQRDAYVNQNSGSLPSRLAHEVGVLQPATFLRRTVIDKVGIPDVGLNFAMDYDLWIRAVKGGLRWAFLDRDLAHARYYEDNKTLGKRGESYEEICSVAAGHYGYLDERWARRWAAFNVSGHDGILRSERNAESDDAGIERETARILRSFNTGFSARKALRSTSESTKRTKAIMEDAAIGADQICQPVDADRASADGLVCYTVGKQRWGFNAGWHRSQMDRWKNRVAEMSADRKTDTAVIVGNGPSLNRTDLSLLGGADVFVSNYAFLKPELMRHATYLCVVNNLVAEQGATRFNLLQGVTKVFPYWLAYCIAEDERTLFAPSVGYPEFSTDIVANVSWRHTVSFFHMQLAYGLGYSRVALIGFDHSYAQDSQKTEGDVIEQAEDDQNHFDPRYFKGKQWHAADVDNMESMYKLARDAFEADGRTIVNATAGGKLELFDRAELSQFLAVAGTGV
ncbi:MAG: glycosyltransferase [Planctomycetota bacterium]